MVLSFPQEQVIFEDKNTFECLKTQLDLFGKKVTLTPLHKKVDDIDEPIKKGIDGIYECNNPPPKYIIAEAKYGSSELGDTKSSGRQMSDKWVKDRLEKSIGKKKAREIIKAMKEKGEVEKVLSQVDELGNVTTQKLDSRANIIGDWL